MVGRGFVFLSRATVCSAKVRLGATAQGHVTYRNGTASFGKECWAMVKFSNLLCRIAMVMLCLTVLGKAMALFGIVVLREAMATRSGAKCVL